MCLTEAWSPEIAQTKEIQNPDIKLTSESGREMFIALADQYDEEISIDRQNELFVDLPGILRNAKYTVCMTHGGKWCGSSLWTRTPDKSVLRKEFGSDKAIA